MNKIGIYKITNIINNNCYIGSATNLKKRWSGHKRQLKLGKHSCKHLQHAYNKYGEDSFIYSVLLFCEKENLILYEQRAINVYKPEYNILKVAGSSLGHKHSEETKLKMSLSRLGNKNRVGKLHTIETKEAISKTLIGNVRSLGNKLSNETKAKIAQAQLGKSPSKETRIKLSKAKTGTKCSEETKNNMSNAQYKRWIK